MERPTDDPKTPSVPSTSPDPSGGSTEPAAERSEEAEASEPPESAPGEAPAVEPPQAAAPAPESSPAAGEAGSNGAKGEDEGEPKGKDEGEPKGKDEGEPKGEDRGEEMGKLLDDPATKKREAVAPKKGAKVSGKIVQIGEKGAFVDFGGREEGFLDLAELRDEKGEITRKVGDQVTGVVASVQGGTKLTLKAKRTGNLAAVLEAHKSGLPVEGKVTGVNKGGLVVRTMGVRAFCPFSQIERHYIEDPSAYVGKRLTFRVTSADAKGKNVVVSRRALLEEQIRGQAEKLRQELAVGQELSGVVARVRPFGAFVDLGGVDGLVHLSEIAHSRIKDPSEAVRIGEEVRVKVLKIENLGAENERISLSIKELLDDPWEAVAASLVPGEKTQGKVVRIVDFGAFLQIAPGVDGLLHVSALAEGRVGHPSDVVEVGQELEPWVVGVDRTARRISLSLVDPALTGVPSGGGRRERGDRSRGPRRESREIREYREASRKSDAGMTSMEEAFQRLRDRSDD